MPLLDKPAIDYVVHVQDNVYEIQADRIEVLDTVITLYLQKKVVGVFAAFDYIIEKRAE
jgi:hypothetical protein